MTTADFQAHEARIAAVAVLQAQIRPNNKAALFDALEAAGIHSIVVAFDGSGDDGQIESVTAFDGTNGELTLPDTMVAMQKVDFDGPSVALRYCSLNEVLEIMAYAFLEQTHDGWESSDGGQGEFTFDVANRSITLEYSERTIAYEGYHHEF